MLKRIRKIISIIALSLPLIMGFGLPGVALAAGTVTWTGGGSDGNWSTPGNWAGGVVPTTGEDVIIDNSATFTNDSVDDIAGLSIASLTFINDVGPPFPTIKVILAQDLTITASITQAQSVTDTADVITSDGSTHNLILGGDVTVTRNSALMLGDNPDDNIALAGHTLTLKDWGASTEASTLIGDNIIGNGSVVFNAPVTDFFVSSTNTYSGTTHVIATDQPINATDGTPFGSSTITVENTGTIDFRYGVDTTISNPIIIAGTANSSPTTSLSFGSYGGATPTLTVPNITLHGATQFSNTSDISTPTTINLAGITTNGHCLKYLGYGNDVTDGPGNGFINGPSGSCAAAASATPTPAPTTTSIKPPDTGFAFTGAHPIITFAVTTVIALIILSTPQYIRKSLGRR